MSIDIKPIRNVADHDAALAEVKRLWGAKAGTRDGDRLDVLATLIDAYEAQHEPIDRPDRIEAIQFRMEQQGLTRKDLEPLLGTRTRVSEVLNRKRALSIGMIRRLHARYRCRCFDPGAATRESDQLAKNYPQPPTQLT